jgi:UDP-glucose-4-epimerase GalE
VKVLVTGGAGYIGSHAVRELVEAGHTVSVLDDLSKGHRSAVHRDVRLVQGDLGDPAALDSALAGAGGVVHFAGLLSVADSLTDPAAYYHVNVGKGLALLDAMARASVPLIVFSSSCATYGMPVGTPMAEDPPQRPSNPYGATKLVFERALADYAGAGLLRAVALRYFNAAGCHPDGSLGEDHRPEEHIVPRAIRAALGQGDGLRVYGDDYDTPDGTCIRDYVHVQDLARAHVAALAPAPAPFRAYNLGTGRGHSVREVIDSVARVTGRPVPAEVGPRRPGDPPVLVAAAERARAELGFVPRWPELDGIVETAVRWMRAHPAGYGARA